MDTYSIQLYLEKGDTCWQGKTYDENMYIVVDQNNIDVSGEFMTLKQAEELKQELINQE